MNEKQLQLLTPEERKIWDAVQRYKPGYTYVTSRLIETIADLREHEHDAGALWTLISQISEPIRQCFIHRTMPFAEFREIAVKWVESISGEGHPDTVRAERDALRERVAELEEWKASLQEALKSLPEGFATFRQRPDENDGKEFFFSALWHNETRCGGERVERCYIINADKLDAALAARPEEKR